ncbi:hypothetical protein ACHAWF_005571 [Thalassiosira exigua]
MMAAIDLLEEDTEFDEVFGNYSATASETKRVQENDPNLICFRMSYDALRHMPANAWELLGRYIARNTHLKRVSLDVPDDKMPKFFEHLTNSRSIEDLTFRQNNFGVDAIRSMVPFLKNTRPKLRELNLQESRTINTEIFELVTEALDGGCMKMLRFNDCSINDITSLDRCTLLSLHYLDLRENNITQFPSSLEKYTAMKQLLLGGNEIGLEGCQSIAYLLQSKKSLLIQLDLSSNKLGDREGEIIANSLKHNTTLTELKLDKNPFGEDGCKAFLKLLNNVSSIQRTCSSNHTLRELKLPSPILPIPFIDILDDDPRTHEERQRDFDRINDIQHHIKFALQINKRNRSWSRRDPGCEKVIETQLNSKRRRALSAIQGVDATYISLFGHIETIYLPNILALAGRNRTELYRMLLEIAPDLSSLINKKSMLEHTIANKEAHLISLTAMVASLSDSIDDLKRRLTSMDDDGGNEADLDDPPGKKSKYQPTC